MGSEMCIRDSCFAVFSGKINLSGILALGFFGMLAIGFSGYKDLNGYVFTTMIFAGVTLALYFPKYLVQIGDYKMSSLIIPLIQIIMFGMGTSMSVKDFASIFKSPKGVIIGVTAQLGIMPVIGFILAKLSNFPPEIAAGIVLIGCSPSGVASNVMAYLARANLALSITITSIATLIAPFVTPLLMKFLAGEFIEINVLTMMWSIVKMIILPIGAGLLFNKLRGKNFMWLDKAMPIMSMLAIGIIITIITAAGRDALISIGFILMILVFATILFWIWNKISPSKLVDEMQIRTRSWWVMCFIFLFASLINPVVTYIALGFLSFFTLREIYSLLNLRAVSYTHLTLPTNREV